MPRAPLLHAFVTSWNVWTVAALRVHAPVVDAEALSVIDIPMEWVAPPPVKMPELQRIDACRVFEKPGAVPRASVDSLTKHDFASLPFSGQYDTRFQNFFNKLKAGGRVKMVALGGSFTAGMECYEPVEGYPCAWPARVQTALSKLFPSSRISLLNMAHGGTTTSVILGAISLLLRDVPGGPGQIDLIMIDTLLNDSREYKQWRSVGSMSAKQVVETSYEQLVRVLHEVAPQAAVVSVTDACPKCFQFAEYHRVVASFYGLPLVDYARLAELTGNPDLWHLHGGHHPSWQSHQILADVVIGTWAMAFRDFCAGAVAPAPTFPNGTLARKELLDQFAICKVGASEYYAANSTGPQPTIFDGWRLFEDRPGKPGWISEQPGAVLTFRLSFGAEPKLLFTFLRSYENLGSAVLTMNNRSVSVEGLDAEHKVSQSHTQWFNAEVTYSHDFEEGLFGFNVTPHSQDLVLNVTAPGAKFKIISVISC